MELKGLESVYYIGKRRIKWRHFGLLFLRFICLRLLSGYFTGIQAHTLQNLPFDFVALK